MQDSTDNFCPDSRGNKPKGVDFGVRFYEMSISKRVSFYVQIKYASQGRYRPAILVAIEPAPASDQGFNDGHQRYHLDIPSISNRHVRTTRF